MAEVADAAAYKDGDYGSATGFKFQSSSKSCDQRWKNSSSKWYPLQTAAAIFPKHLPLPEELYLLESTNVDTVSGATYSSVGIINAVRNALAQAAVDGSTVPASTRKYKQEEQSESQSAPRTRTVSGNFPYPDGTYYGTAEGYLGDVKVAIVLKIRTIQSVQILENEDDAAFFDRTCSGQSYLKIPTTGVNVIYKANLQF